MTKCYIFRKIITLTDRSCIECTLRLLQYPSSPIGSDIRNVDLWYMCYSTLYVLVVSANPIVEIGTLKNFDFGLDLWSDVDNFSLF